ncbi:MAG: addiction module protein [Candidatus Brocadia sp. WS118]|nr:MAG: addiction module protein [Candidatus Brocadia sp. WS118]
MKLVIRNIYKKEITVRITDIPEIAKLSTQEKILLVEDIWDSIALDESAVPIPHSHRDELDRRLRIHESAPGNLLTLEELQARIEKRK